MVCVLKVTVEVKLHSFYTLALHANDRPASCSVNSIKYEAGHAPQSVRTYWRLNMVIQSSLITLLTELSRIKMISEFS